ncbi:MAG: DUF885 domain-containing protein [Alphaproteobacteria bacterium]|nr:DUF885 domain-containing protein [Alphaproteobacteria bacterium]MBL7098479.1 DUF885 domain-containing protein [Alphaproteobacteria bacterium]
MEDSLRLSPVGATQTGDHRFDAELDDLSAAGRAARLKVAKDTVEALTVLDRSRLSRANQVDAALLLNDTKRAVWEDEVLQNWAWEPRTYSEIYSNAVYGLMSREFAPLPARMASAIARMEKMSKVFADMRASLVLARVPEIAAKTAAKQLPGALGVVDEMVMPNASALDAAGQARLKAAYDGLKKAIADHQAWMDGTLVPGAKGDFRIGAKMFDEKLAFTLNSPMTRKEIRTRADAAVKATRAAMYAVARRALAGHAGAPAMPDAPTPEQQQAVIEAALDLAYAQKPAPDKVVETCTAALNRATEFVRARDLVTLPDAPVAIETMPVFAQGVAVAYCNSPGPLDRGLKTYVDVSPIPKGWTKEQADSFLREYNNYGIQDVAVHEAMPGHYLQLWHANRYPSVLRAVLGSGSFIEGWAVYSEKMMVDEGFRKDEPLNELCMLKVRLRTITNAILDQAVHVDGISQADAMTLMTKTAFQQEREAAGKWVRAQLSSTQLSTYFVGVSEHDALRADAEKRQGFVLKAYHDQVLSYGSPPVRYVRALMFNEAIT